MTYQKLFDHCQPLTPAIGRGVIRAKVAELTGIKIRIAKTTMDVKVCRGMYLSARNTNSRIVQQLGTNVVVLPREGNNNCWERFVEVKEYMHAFDSEDEATDTGEEFDNLLKEFTSSENMKRSEQMTGEIKAFWRALAALCPEPQRQALIAERDARGPDLSDYAVALRLKIPELYVPGLFQPWYEENLKEVLA
ncbi:MAG TPA: hypothetical protein VNW53_11655 [Phenylobacterium sp.]|jgi:hypothetical protein|uniref:hypothetical protein n=1 Tax=Phenylobacterium sp. TaxID=1871053 RepID=UPI002D0403D6|nr:hypothetical protein [Phenylobacterium sp.]HXA39648.1 hypothetical protein [Phenylobacterium sp.]